MTNDIAIRQPMSFPETERLAHLMAGARLVPTWFQQSPGDCMLLIDLARQWRMNPWMLAQECYSIKGRLMPSGKLAAAVINTNGNLAERLRYEYSGTGDDLTITVIGRFAMEQEPRSVSLRLRDARTANEAWQKQPDQQLMYAGVRKWGRRHVPELMLGIVFREEADEVAEPEPYRAPTPAFDGKVSAPMRPTSELPEIQTPQPLDDPIDTDTGEILERPFPHVIETRMRGEFLRILTQECLASQTLEEIDERISLNQDSLLRIRETWPDLYRQFEKNIEAHKAALYEASQSAGS